MGWDRMRVACLIETIELDGDRRPVESCLFAACAAPAGPKKRLYKPNVDLGCSALPRL
jgi:hypothetical protein